MAQHLAIGEDVAQVFRERRFAGTEETGDPDANPFGGVRPRLVDRLQQITVVALDVVGGDVLGDFRGDELLVQLIELDDLLDLLTEVALQQFLYLHPKASGRVCVSVRVST